MREARGGKCTGIRRAYIPLRLFRARGRVSSSARRRSNRRRRCRRRRCRRRRRRRRRR